MKVLDFSNTPENQKISILSLQFEELNKGESLLIQGNCAFSFLSEFQEHHWGKYDWMPFFSGPKIWEGLFVKKQNDTTSINSFMGVEHSQCDRFFVDGENALLDGDEEKGKVFIRKFLSCTRRHFLLEEKFLFPLFEQKTGMTMGPTQVMRLEHEQIRGLLNEMEMSLEEGDYDRISDIGETLNLLIQQHNTKEENVLYPMTDQHLSEEKVELLKEMQQFTL